MQSNYLDNEVFILGCARSGTTMMSSILFASGLFAEYHAESLIISVCMPKYGDLADEKKLETFLNDWIASRQGKRSGLTKEDFREIVHEANLNYFYIHKLLMSKLCLTQNKKNWAESTPANIFHIRQLIKYFPKCKIILMVRDGRDVVLSLDKLDWISLPLGIKNSHMRLWWGACQWQEIIETGLKALKENESNDKILVVQFENLILNPKDQIDRIARFLQVDLASLLTDNGAVRLKESNSAYGDKFTTLSKGSIGRWKKKLTSSQKQVLEATCYAGLEQYQYMPTASYWIRVLLFFPSRAVILYMKIKRYLRFRTILGQKINDSLEK